MPRKYTPRIEVVCEICGKSIMLPPSMVARGRRHCSAKCMGVAKRRPAQFTCIGCGKIVETKASKAERQKYCSAACRKEHQKQKIVCEVCGKERKVTPTQATQGARFCSWKCARQVLNKPRPVVVCEQCGKECAVPPSRVRQGMRFCSYSCRSIWNITHGAMASPTSIELILYRMLEYLKVEYLSQYPIPGAGTVADAYVPALNLVLYADGDYWHALPKTVKRDQRQNKRLAELGYKFARLSESDLRTNPIAAVKAVLTG